MKKIGLLLIFHTSYQVIVKSRVLQAEQKENENELLLFITVVRLVPIYEPWSFFFPSPFTAVQWQCRNRSCLCLSVTNMRYKRVLTMEMVVSANKPSPNTKPLLMNFMVWVVSAKNEKELKTIVVYFSFSCGFPFLRSLVVWFLFPSGGSLSVRSLIARPLGLIIGLTPQINLCACLPLCLSECLHMHVCSLLLLFTLIVSVMSCFIDNANCLWL